MANYVAPNPCNGQRIQIDGLRQPLWNMLKILLCWWKRTTHSFVPNCRGGGGQNCKFLGKNPQVHLINIKEWPRNPPPPVLPPILRNLDSFSPVAFYLCAFCAWDSLSFFLIIHFLLIQNMSSFLQFMWPNAWAIRSLKHDNADALAGFDDLKDFLESDNFKPFLKLEDESIKPKWIFTRDGHDGPRFPPTRKAMIKFFKENAIDGSKSMSEFSHHLWPIGYTRCHVVPYTTIPYGLHCPYGLYCPRMALSNLD